MVTNDTQKSHQQIMEEAYEWHLTLEDGDATAEEQRAFRSWMDGNPKHEAAYAEAAASWREFGTLRRKHLDPDVSASVVHEPQRGAVRLLLNKPMGSRLRYTLSTAAALIVTVAIVISQWPEDSDRDGGSISTPALARYETGVGETKSVMLSDGTTALLSAATQLQTRMSAESRELELTQGAAMFEVTKDPDRPFSVSAGRVKATALGTVFEVRNNGGLVRVAVEEGRVEYTSSLMISGQKSGMVNRQELGAGEFGASPENAQSDRFGRFDTGSFAVWRRSRLDYEGATLFELVADANRYSATPIVIRGNPATVEAMTISAYFDSTDIDSMLATLPQLFPVEVQDSGLSQIVVHIK